MAVDVAISSVNLDHLYAKTQEEKHFDSDTLLGSLGDWSVEDDDLLTALFGDDKTFNTFVDSPRSDSSSSDSYLTPISPDSAYLSPDESFAPSPDMADLDPNCDVVSTTSGSELHSENNFLIDMNIDWTNFDLPNEVFNIKEEDNSSSDSELSVITSSTLPVATSTAITVNERTLAATVHSITPTTAVSSFCAPSSSSSSCKATSLVLDPEEQRLLQAEGIVLPTNTTLTKAEEKVLKKVRRKIKNKQSAQESRKKKKFYVDGLESRVKACTDENQSLQKKVQMLENRNKSLLQQLKQLQSVISNTHPSKAQAGTCLMVLMLAFGLVLFPINNIGTSKKGSVASYAPVNVRSRTLLQVNDDYVQTEEGLSTGSKYSSINTSEITLEASLASSLIDSPLSDISIKVPAVHEETDDRAKEASPKMKSERR